MNEMVERLARAIYEHQTGGSPFYGVGSGPDHDEAYALAHIVLAEIAAPTEGMQVAGVKVGVEIARTADGMGHCITPSLIWRAMAAEAIKGGSPV